MLRAPTNRPLDRPSSLGPPAVDDISFKFLYQREPLPRDHHHSPSHQRPHFRIYRVPK